MSRLFMGMRQITGEHVRIGNWMRDGKKKKKMYVFDKQTQDTSSLSDKHTKKLDFNTSKSILR